MSSCGSLERERAAGAALGVRVLGAAASAAAARGLEDLGDHGRARCGQDAGRGGMGARAGRRRAAGGSGRGQAGGAGGRDDRPGARRDGVWRKRDPCLFAAGPADRSGRRRGSGWSGRTGRRRRSFRRMSPEAMRGPQFDAAWADELGKWKKGAEAWDQLQFALRLGKNPRQVVTTTPRNVGVLKAILKNPSTVITHAPTEANRAYLAESFLAEVQHPLWRHAAWAAGAGRRAGRGCGRRAVDAGDAGAGAGGCELPVFSRIVVAVDPPVTSSKKSDECGIVVVGADTRGDPRDWRAVVLEDASVQGRLARGLGAGGAGGDGAARGGPAGGRGQPGRRSGGAGGADDRPAWCRSGRFMRRGRRCCGPSRWRPCTSRGGCGHLRGLQRAGRADVPDDGDGLEGQGIAGPAGCAGLGADRADGEPGHRVARPSVRSV